MPNHLTFKTVALPIEEWGEGTRARSLRGPSKRAILNGGHARPSAIIVDQRLRKRLDNFLSQGISKTSKLVCLTLDNNEHDCVLTCATAAAPLPNRFFLIPGLRRSLRASPRSLPKMPFRPLVP